MAETVAQQNSRWIAAGNILSKTEQNANKDSLVAAACIACDAHFTAAYAMWKVYYGQ